MECIYCIVDLHSLTGGYDVSTMASRTRDMAIGLLAAGIDPERSLLFVQSRVAEHSELQWLFTTLTPLGELERMTQFKDKSERMESVPAGLLAYPILQAADILLYRADRVPVGEDQLQHLELTREIARKWNSAFADTDPFFPEPQALLTPARRILGLDGQSKMSKSLGNTIGLLDPPEVVWNKLRPAMTDPARVTRRDPGNPEVCNMFTLHRSFSAPDTVATVDAQCRSAGWGCLDCKRVLADAMENALGPIRGRAEALKSDPASVDTILETGAERARTLARETMAEVRDRMGFWHPED